MSRTGKGNFERGLKRLKDDKEGIIDGTSQGINIKRFKARFRKRTSFQLNHF